MIDNDEVIEALRQARIPRRYYEQDRGLSSCGKAGEALKEQIEKGNLVEEIRSGKGLFFVGQSTLDLFFFTARALLLKQNAVITMSLAVLSKVLHTDKFNEVIPDTDVLGIVGFYDSHYSKAYSEEILNQMEWFLRKRLLDEKSIMLHSTESIEMCKWWSKGLLNEISKSCNIIE